MDRWSLIAKHVLVHDYPISSTAPEYKQYICSKVPDICGTEHMNTVLSILPWFQVSVFFMTMDQVLMMIKALNGNEGFVLSWVLKKACRRLSPGGMAGTGTGTCQQTPQEWDWVKIPEVKEGMKEVKQRGPEQEMQNAGWSSEDCLHVFLHHLLTPVYKSVLC